MKHGHGLHRHAVIPLPPHDRVPHVCPIRTSNLSAHRLEAYVHSLTEREVYESLRDLRGSFHHSHGHSVTSLNARASLVAALRDSRHAHLLIGSGAHAGTKWGKSGGRVGQSLKEKAEKEAKDSGADEDETKEVGRLVSIELQCQHAEEEEKPEGKSEGHEGGAEGHKGSGKAEKRKSRWAESGEVLCVVPKATGSDKVKLRAKTVHDPAWINWTGKGWKGFTHQGEEFAYQVPGFALNSIIDLLPENGIWGVRCPPKVIEIEAKDPEGGSSRAKIAVYPDHTNSLKGRIGAKHTEEIGEHDMAKRSLFDLLFKAAKAIDEGFQKIPLLPAKVEVSTPEGSWHVNLGYQEDKDSNAVFMQVDVGAGFDPLFGMAVKIPVPGLKLLEIIPEKLRKYLADIVAYFELEGKTFLNFSVGRFAVRELNVKGEFGGVIGASLNFSVEIGAESVLKVIAKAGTEIKPDGFIQSGGIGNGDELKVNWKLLLEFGGLTGSISWDVWDGKFTHENSWHFLESQEIFRTNLNRLF